MLGSFSRESGEGGIDMEWLLFGAIALAAISYRDDLGNGIFGSDGPFGLDFDALESFLEDKSLVGALMLALLFADT